MRTQSAVLEHPGGHPAPLGSETVPPPAIGLCLSTGHVAARYLVTAIRETYGDAAHVLDGEAGAGTDGARSRHVGRTFIPAPSGPPAAAGTGHLERIAELATDRPYVDAGHTSLAGVPLVISRFPGRVRLLHLVDDPLLVAVSGAGATPGEPPSSPAGGLSAWIPNPFEIRCAHPETRDAWDGMSPFEKNLWRWGEYHLAAMAIRRRFPHVPVLQISWNELRTSSVAMAWVASFLGLPPRNRPWRTSPEAARPPRSDTAAGNDWRRYDRYPWVLELAESLGVPVNPVGLEERMAHYARAGSGAGRRHAWSRRLRGRWVGAVRRLAPSGRD